MIDEKEPGQKFVKADSADDEFIIDLTEEVIVEAKDDNDQSELPEETADDAPQTLQDDNASQVETGEEIISKDVTDDLDLQEDEAIVDLLDQFAEDQDDISEDQTIALELGASPDVEKSETGEVTEQFDLKGLDDGEVTEQFDLKTFDDGEVTKQFDLKAFDNAEVTEQFDLKAFDNAEVTEQFDLKNLDDGEVTEQFDLKAFEDRDVTEQFDLKAFDDGDVTEQFDLKTLDDGDVTEQFDLKAFEENDDITDDDSRDETDEDFGATDDNETAAFQGMETGEVTEQFDLKAFDDGDGTEQFDLKALDQDDTIIVDNSQDEADEDFGAMADDETAVAQRDEDVFDLEEEIELEYKLDDDEDELIDLNEEETSDLMDSDDLPDLEAIGDDLPDLEAIGEFDFEDEDGLELEEPGADSSDDIIARSVERSLGQDDDPEPVELVDEAEFDEEDGDAIMDLDDSSGDEEIVLALADEEPLTAEDGEDLLDLNGGANLDTDDEIIPLDDLETQTGEEIIEITEFDQHFPSDSEALLKQSGIFDSSGANEEDFLELIDIEDDDLSDDEAIAEFSDVVKNAQEIEITKLNQFFSNDLEESQSETQTPKSIHNGDPENILLKDQAAEFRPGDSESMKFRLSDELPAVAEIVSNLTPNSTAGAEPPGSADEKFDFDIDQRAIARQVDRLDTFLSEDAADEPEVAPLLDGQAAQEEPFGLDRSQTGQGLAEWPAIPAGQINAAIERVINEKFSAKIEGIIYEVIEKAVAKEIERLKGALIGKNTIEDYDR